MILIEAHVMVRYFKIAFSNTSPVPQKVKYITNFFSNLMCVREIAVEILLETHMMVNRN